MWLKRGAVPRFPHWRIFFKVWGAWAFEILNRFDHVQWSWWYITSSIPPCSGQLFTLKMREVNSEISRLRENKVNYIPEVWWIVFEFAKPTIIPPPSDGIVRSHIRGVEVPDSQAYSRYSVGELLDPVTYTEDLETPQNQESILRNLDTMRFFTTCTEVKIYNVR